ncbi:MAG TPA: Smr/MutS family protein [Gemmatimonadaceae bacterium]|nr:Smr/MutS family protein [Gemmatimonadaceae bacterium]
MNAHTLALLEFDRVLDAVAGYAASAPGAAHVRALRPATDLQGVQAEHEKVSAMRALRARREGWNPHPVPELDVPLQRLRAAGARWSGAELLDGARLLASSRLTRSDLEQGTAADERTCALEPFIHELLVAPGPEAAIARAVDADGALRDDASPLLRRLRRELRGAEGELVQLLERTMARLDAHLRVPDMSVTVRNGRYVIPVRREGRAAVGGIVHDASATGGTLFVEPPAAIEMGNRIREMEAEEQEEVQRILAELTDRLRPYREPMVSALHVLVELDSLSARARYADALGCAPPALVPPGEGFALHGARHPLLIAQGRAVVPFDLTMDPRERTLLVSGPNTGGKTVLLKAVGLLSAMVQAGIPAPVAGRSRIPVYDAIYADIGDEQSIEASLSTFSAHVKNLGVILAEASPRSLVLIDELGSGTDPAEGAALGSAILDELTSRGTLTVATTHLGALKLLATETPFIVNASLQFDEAVLAPTYRLVKGVPGRSYGLSIARRLALPAPVLDRAEARLPRGERDLGELVADVERRSAELADRERDASTRLARAEARAADLAAREERLRERERAVEREARRDARTYLLQARSDVERVIVELRESVAAADTSEVDAALREARRAVESLAAGQAEALARMESDHEQASERAAAAAHGAQSGAQARHRGEAAELEVGDAVTVATLGGREGRIVEIRDGGAVVAVGAMKVTVPLGSVQRTHAAAHPVEEARTLVGDLPEVDAPTEIDLRGLRADDAEHTVLQAIDAAVRADLHTLRIIHGKGTGALRDVVSELLRADPRVRTFRLGAWNEGGSGVTVAELA